MNSRVWYLFNYIQRSMLVPMSIRSWLFAKMGCDIHRSARIASGVFVGSKKLRVAADVFININCFLDGTEYITLEQFVRVGPHVKMLTGTHTVNPDVLRRSGISKAINMPITINKGSWIGMGAMILPGVTIAEGCVIGAGAVVVDSTEPNGLYVGNPARRIKDLPVKSNI